MDSVELLQYSVKNAFEILGSVTADMTQEQADWPPPGTANPAGALYWHTIDSTDQIVHGWGLGQAPLSQTAGWQDKVLVASAPEGEEDMAVIMRAVRIDLPVGHEYAGAVAEATQTWLASLTPDDLDRKIETPYGELVLGQMVEMFVAWHVSAHCGEIAVLKGLQGARGYPF